MEQVNWNDNKTKILKEFEVQQIEESEGSLYIRSDEWTPLLIYKNLEQATGIKKTILQVEVREMRNLGILELLPAVDGEYYAPCGSGWQIKTKGLNLVRHLAEGKSPDSFFEQLTKHVPVT